MRTVDVQHRAFLRILVEDEQNLCCIIMLTNVVEKNSITPLGSKN